MTDILQERIASLETQLKEWQTRRTQAADALNEAQSAILQLQGALAFARSLTDTPAVPNVNDYAAPTGPPERES